MHIEQQTNHAFKLLPLCGSANLGLSIQEPEPSILSKSI